VATWPLPVRAQKASGERHIGILMAYQDSNAGAQALLEVFRSGLKNSGWVEGRNIQFTHRWAGSDLDLMQRSAKELVALQPDILLASDTPPTAALLRETHAIPIVFANIVDPVGSGFVASLSRPGGNVTGFVNLEASMAGKWLELLKALAPRLDRLVVPFNPATSPFSHIYLDYFNSTAPSFGVQVVAASVTDMAALEALVAAQAHESNTGFIPVPGAFMFAHRAEIAALVARNRLPAVYNNRTYVDAGGLLSYGNIIADNYLRASAYVARILKGEKPSELPVQFPVKFEMVINLRAAKQLGIAVSPALLATADEVIE